MLIAAIDLETTGVHKEAEIIELGVCMVDSEQRVKIREISILFRPIVWDERADAAEQVHRIPKEVAMKYGVDIGSVDIMAELKYRPDVLVSHNAEFEKKLVKKYWPELNDLKWLCTLNDLDHSIFTKYSCRTLPHLVGDYGIDVRAHHRALDDARSCAHILLAHDVANAIARIDAPKFDVYVVTKEESESTIESIRKLGFRWLREHKMWKAAARTQSEVDTICDELQRIAPNLIPGIEAL